jgi:hypothetical protein
MTDEARQVLEVALRLSPEEQLSLVRELLAQLEGKVDLEDLLNELEGRTLEGDLDEDGEIGWEDVHRAIEAELKRRQNQ